eukprot:CAMPEP_0113644988 /NCGR_PEP_ID=MMETSP0017_2-20120614/23689_1 /TAXON_ID=2856 /ORGANISM="Cylindrotheca closterium" /LENGTH=214 /DNA_ID=CAMNT_0000556651 /DNA_START=287 /DNA_END=931 /DNA_ORIENTATION=- /assembly_acc=CAM_ASM_000147
MGEDAHAYYTKRATSLMPRYTGPTENLTEEQIGIRDSILKSRPGTGLQGPFGPWLSVPSIAQPAQTLGHACRYGTSLSKKESELVILLVGSKLDSVTEIQIHIGEAIDAGWAMDLVGILPILGASQGNRGSSPTFLQDVRTHLLPQLSTERERAIAIFVAELLETNQVTDATYASTKEAVDGQDSVLVEVTSIVGYYSFVCWTLNVFQIPPTLP